jgi:HSP20 family molecular chaperone IbpA
VDPNSIQATLRDGILHLTLSKRPEAQRQKVAITNGNGDVKRIETA